MFARRERGVDRVQLAVAAALDRDLGGGGVSARVTGRGVGGPRTLIVRLGGGRGQGVGVSWGTNRASTTRYRARDKLNRQILK